MHSTNALKESLKMISCFLKLVFFRKIIIVLCTGVYFFLLPAYGKEEVIVDATHWDITDLDGYGQFFIKTLPAYRKVLAAKGIDAMFLPLPYSSYVLGGELVKDSKRDVTDYLKNKFVTDNKNNLKLYFENKLMCSSFGQEWKGYLDSLFCFGAVSRGMKLLRVDGSFYQKEYMETVLGKLPSGFGINSSFSFFIDDRFEDEEAVRKAREIKELMKTEYGKNVFLYDCFMHDRLDELILLQQESTIEALDGVIEERKCTGLNDDNVLSVSRFSSILPGREEGPSCPLSYSDSYYYNFKARERAYICLLFYQGHAVIHFSDLYDEWHENGDFKRRPTIIAGYLFDVIGVVKPVRSKKVKLVRWKYDGGAQKETPLKMHVAKRGHVILVLNASKQTNKIAISLGEIDFPIDHLLCTCRFSKIETAANKIFITVPSEKAILVYPDINKWKKE